MALPVKIQKVETLRDILGAQVNAFRQVLPKHMTPERLVRIACAAASRQPQLLQCTSVSVLRSMMHAAELGLEPGGALGEAYLVPYGSECQLIPGFRGLISLARRSGQIVSIEAHIVYKTDRFRCQYGMDTVLEHEPDWEAERSDEDIKAAYAIARLRDGGVQVEVMTKPDIEAIRKRSKAGGNGPWKTDFAEMARKTVVKRLCKYLPLSTELAAAVELDNRSEAGESQVGVIDVPGLAEEAPALASVPEQTAPATTKDKVKAAVREKAAVSVTIEGAATDAPTATDEDLDRMPAWAEPGSEG